MLHRSDLSAARSRAPSLKSRPGRPDPGSGRSALKTEDRDRDRDGGTNDQERSTGVELRSIFP
eukprot:8800536-Alexandrium_andersonii.AAC.1